MMDAVEFLKTYRRLCASFSSGGSNDCRDCPLHTIGHCGSMKHSDPSKIVPIVEQWAKEHPIKTRQSEFLKMFPNAFMDGQVLNLCPKGFEGRTDCIARYNCANCRHEYWLQEVE